MVKHLVASKIRTTFLLIFSLTTGSAFSQAPPAEFIQGIQLVNRDVASAKRLMYIAAAKSPGFYGSYHFLGVIYAGENKTDSAIFYLKKSIALNQANLNHTKEFSYSHLMDVYLQRHEFGACYQTATDALKDVPDSPTIIAALKDASLWAFYIKDDGLDTKYLSHDIKEDYTVTSISQEYLIARYLQLNGENLSVAGQSLINKDNAAYDVLNCVSATTKQQVKLFFKLNWDLGKDFGGKIAPTQPIIDGKQYSPLERLGALFVSNNRIDMATAFQQLGLN